MMTKAFLLGFVCFFVAKSVSSYRVEKLSSNDGVFFIEISNYAQISWSDGPSDVCSEVKIRASVQHSPRSLMKPLNDADYQIFNCSNTYVNLGPGSNSNCTHIASFYRICDDVIKVPIDTSRRGIFSMMKFDQDDSKSFDQVDGGIILAVAPFKIVREKSLTYKIVLGESYETSEKFHEKFQIFSAQYFAGSDTYKISTMPNESFYVQWKSVTIVSRQSTSYKTGAGGLVLAILFVYAILRLLCFCRLQRIKADDDRIVQAAANFIANRDGNITRVRVV